jgi:uncharacterized protein YdcH (DUF465 family)
MAKNTRNYPKKPDEEYKETIRKLKARLGRIQKKFDKLLDDYNSLEEAWKKTEAFLKASVEDIPIEELLKHNKLPKKAVRKKQPKQDERQTAIENALKFLEDKKKKE